MLSSVSLQLHEASEYLVDRADYSWNYSGLEFSSSESIDRCEDDLMLRRASQTSLTLSLVFDTKTNLPIFRRL